MGPRHGRLHSLSLIPPPPLLRSPLYNDDTSRAAPSRTIGLLTRDNGAAEWRQWRTTGTHQPHHPAARRATMWATTLRGYRSPPFRTRHSRPMPHSSRSPCAIPSPLHRSTSVMSLPSITIATARHPIRTSPPTSLPRSSSVLWKRSRSSGSGNRTRAGPGTAQAAARAVPSAPGCSRSPTTP